MSEMIVVQYGEIKLEPVVYTIKRHLTKRLFRRSIVEYSVETKYCKMIGFNSLAEIYKNLLFADVKPENIKFEE